MNKTNVIQIAIVVAVLITALPIALTAHRSYSGYQNIDWNNASKAVTFNLLKGENVDGSFSIANDEDTDYIVHNQAVGEVIVQKAFNGQASFNFEATVDGEYYLRIYYNKPFGENFNYFYSVSSVFLGLNYIFWIGFVIAIGVVLELIVIIKKRKVKQ